MTANRPSEAFDPDAIASVADETEVDADRLADLLDRLQRVIRPERTADDLVYEYRKAFARDPLIERRPDAYYLAVPGHVWPEFGDALDCSSAELRALRSVHDRQFHATLGDHGDDRAPLILLRKADSASGSEADAD